MPIAAARRVSFTCKPAADGRTFLPPLGYDRAALRPLRHAACSESLLPLFPLFSLTPPPLLTLALPQPACYRGLQDVHQPSLSYSLVGLCACTELASPPAHHAPNPTAGHRVGWCCGRSLPICPLLDADVRSCACVLETRGRGHFLMLQQRTCGSLKHSIMRDYAAVVCVSRYLCNTSNCNQTSTAIRGADATH